jgi:hypothetical protein
MVAGLVLTLARAGERHCHAGACFFLAGRSPASSRGHIGATDHRTRTDNSGHQRRAFLQLIARRAGHHRFPGLPDTEEDTGSGLDRPCRARPADRSLVAEDRSAEGVRDRTGPEPAGTRWVHAEPAGRGVQRAPPVSTGAKEPQVRPRRSRYQAALQVAGQSSSLPTSITGAWSVTRPFGSSRSGRDRDHDRAGRVGGSAMELWASTAGDPASPRTRRARATTPTESSRIAARWR